MSQFQTVCKRRQFYLLCEAQILDFASHLYIFGIYCTLASSQDVIMCSGSQTLPNIEYGFLHPKQLVCVVKTVSRAELNLLWLHLTA